MHALEEANITVCTPSLFPLICYMIFAGIVRKTLLALAIICIGSTWSTKAAQTLPRVSLSGNQPVVVSEMVPLGRLASSNELKLAISLPRHHLDVLTNLLEQIYDPTSPSYHHYLTPDEFAAQFGPTDAEYQSLIDFANRHGFTLTVRHPNRMLLQVSAPVSNIERAFQVTLRTYSHPTESRTFFAPDTEPSVEAGIPISYVGGLDNFSRPHPQNLYRSPLKSVANVSPKIIGSGPNGALAGFDYRAAYVPGTTLTGAGQSIGLVEYDGYYAGDITAYQNLTGVPNVPLQIVLLDGFDGVPTPAPNSQNGEVALDIEMATSMAPSLKQVVVYEDDPNVGQFNTVLQAMSTNTLIKQFSCSWGFSPSITTGQRNTMDAYFQEFAAQGQSFFVSSGDSGAYAGAVEPPEDDPYVTIVGGTTLATVGPGGAWLSETAWNTQEGTVLGNDVIQGTGGGISAAYNIPSWQQGVNVNTNHGSTSKRNGPDVAMVADNIFIVADNGQQENTGGTSAAAPLWAAFAALVNQRAVSVGLGTIGFINPALYHIGTNSSFNACFDDVTSGNNTNAIATQFFAVPGYDLCTGLGTPTGSSLIIALTQPDGFQITPGRGLVANGPVGGPFSVSAQTLSLTNIGKPAFNWSLGTTSTWLNASLNHATLTAGGAANNVSLTLNPSGSQLPAGVYTANVWFTNLSSGLVQLRQLTLQVGQELVQDGGFEAGDFTYWNLVGAVDVYTNDFSDVANGSANYSPYAGNYFAAMGEDNVLAYLSQNLSTRAGQFYLISLWLANPNGATPNQFQVQWNGSAAITNIIFNQLNMGAFDYSNMLFVAQAVTNGTTLKLGFRNDKDYFALDNVSVQPIPAPAIQLPQMVNGFLQFSWVALPNVQYQVQYKTNLTQTGWVNLGGAVTATTNPMTFTDDSSSGKQRFYRVELLPY